MEKNHEGILRKFDRLKGEILLGKVQIKGQDNIEKLPPDEYINEKHILHDLIRGFYKPKGKNYILSYMATELEHNYGKQIIWKNESDFETIYMQPPNAEKDVRKKGDISAARYNMTHKIPIGIIHRIAKGEYKILGLGLISEEREDGIFIVLPYKFNNKEKSVEILFNEFNKLSEEEKSEFIKKAIKEIKRIEFQ